MDEKRIDLKAALRELGTGESGDAGPHAGVKRLIAYRQGTLPAAEREALQEHLSLCARCTGLLLELRDFEAAADRGDAGPEALRQAAWESLVQRLPEKTPVVRPKRLPPFLLAAAAALLLAVIGLAVWAVVTAEQSRERLAGLERRLEQREAALATLRRSLAEAERQLAAARGQPAGQVEKLEARVAELTAELAEIRGTAPARRDPVAVASREIEVSVSPRFVLRGQEAPGGSFLRVGVTNPVRTAQGRFVVALSLADPPAYGEYRLELVDRQGKVIWSARRPGGSLLGDAGTSVAVSGLGPGLYRLRIEGLRPDRTELLGEYLLEVTP